LITDTGPIDPQRKGAAGPLPNLIVAGVPKAATTALFSALSEHPDVHPSTVKETSHFAPLRWGQSPGPIEDYRRFFIGWQGQPVVLESTPGYFYGGQPLAQALRAACPEARVVVVLREPADRCISFWAWMKTRARLPVNLTLEDYLQTCQRLSRTDLARRDSNPYWGLHGGNYAEFLPSWHAAFGSRIRTCFYEDLVSAPEAFLEELAGWLELPPAGPWQLRRENVTGSVRSGRVNRVAHAVNDVLRPSLRRAPGLKRAASRAYGKLNRRPMPSDNEVSAEIRCELSDYYRQPNDRLVEQLNRHEGVRLPSWLTTL
jgi:hypothetical protein